MTFQTAKTGAARNSFFKDWKVASLCFGCTETACYSLSKSRKVASGLYSINSNSIENRNMEHKGRNKGGRPKKETAEKLSYRIGVKMAAADYFRLLTRAYEAGISPSEYMRECFRNGYVQERLSKEHSDYVRQLCGMANNLNQLAHNANAGGFSEARWDCKVAVARIHELLNKIGI